MEEDEGILSQALQGTINYVSGTDIVFLATSLVLVPRVVLAPGTYQTNNKISGPVFSQTSQHKLPLMRQYSYRYPLARPPNTVASAQLFYYGILQKAHLADLNVTSVIW